MRFALFDADGVNHIGIVREAGLLDFTKAYQAYHLIHAGEMTPPVTNMVALIREGRFERDTFDAVLSFVDRHNLDEVFTVSDDPTLRAPIPHPDKLIALGGNYRFPDEPDPDEPPLFFKLASSVIGPEEPVVYRNILDPVEPEIELAVVIGRQARSVSQADAMDYVAGYTVLNDITARALQNVAWEAHRPWSYTKSIDTFTPMGPYLVLPDAVSDPHDLAMTLRVNGEVRLEANTNTMLFNIPYLIEYISQYITLEPGDVIATGTPGHPEGLQPGDVVELEIEEVGTLRNPVVAEE